MSDLFNEKSKEWDKNEIVQGISSAVGAAILQQIALQPDMEVMDFGAGTGLISSQLAPLVKTIVAVDVSQAMLEKLQSKPALQGKVEIVCRDILQQPLTQSFDLIISAMAMHHVENTDLLVQRFHEHLKPTGQIALADLDAEDGSFHEAGTKGVYHHGFERDELVHKFQQQGFSEVKMTTAHVVNKEKSYPVFLLTAIKSKGDE